MTNRKRKAWKGIEVTDVDEIMLEDWWAFHGPKRQRRTVHFRLGRPIFDASGPAWCCPIQFAEGPGWGKKPRLAQAAKWRTIYGAGPGDSTRNALNLVWNVFVDPGAAPSPKQAARTFAALTNSAR